MLRAAAAFQKALRSVVGERSRRCSRDVQVGGNDSCRVEVVRRVKKMKHRGKGQSNVE